MTKSVNIVKSTALALATAIAATSLLPIAQASAHDRHHAAKHGYNHSNWNKRSHRKFHKHYGRGNHGVHAYNKSRHHQVRRKKSNKGNLIAAGVIGLALGAIIASEASKKKSHSNQQYRQPTHQPGYQYNPTHRNSLQQHEYSLDRYGNRVSSAPQQRFDEPEVITFRDTASLEPWSAGWREWCSNRYRSFNAQTGTFRGFDGLDHFCVPK